MIGGYTATVQSALRVSDQRGYAMLLCIAAAAAISSSRAAAQSQTTTTLGFDGLPDLSLNVDDFGVSFTGAQVLACGGSLNCGPFPPFSGSNVIYDASNGVITATFDKQVTGNVDKVSARVTGNRNITMTAFDAQSQVLGTMQTGGANYVGSNTGIPANKLLEITSTTAPIASVTFHDSGDTYTIDDFSFRGSVEFVVLDPGHGQILTSGQLKYQRQPSHTLGVIEDVVVLDMAKAVRTQLQAANVLVKLTRETSLAPFAPPNCGVPCKADLNKRAEWIDKQEADVLVSVHTNASSSPVVNGAESHYDTSSPDADSPSLAQLVLDRVVALGLGNRSVVPQKLAVLRTATRIPSALVEVGFHTNWQLAPSQTVTDEARLNDPAFRSAAAKAISDGIQDFY